MVLLLFIVALYLIFHVIADDCCEVFVLFDCCVVAFVALTNFGGMIVFQRI